MNEEQHKNNVCINPTIMENAEDSLVKWSAMPNNLREKVFTIMFHCQLFQSVTCQAKNNVRSTLAAKQCSQKVLH